MMNAKFDNTDERILVLIPAGQEAPVDDATRSQAGLSFDCCAEAVDLCQKLENGAGAVLLLEEALTPSAASWLTDTLSRQGPWSDIPIVILSGGEETSEQSERFLQTLGPARNVMLLDRPIRATSLISVLQCALRARRCQYEVRDLRRQEEPAVGPTEEPLTAPKQEEPALSETATAPAPEAMTAPVEAPAEPVADTTPHILLVEDNPDARDVIQTMLRLEGHNVEAAESGPEGVEKALAIRPSVAFIDISLPGFDGYQVARQLRAAIGSDIFLVALTAFGLSADRVRTQAAGFDAHLVKPVEPEQLSRILAEAKLSAGPVL